LILQRYFNLSDDQVEFEICDRISFMHFLKWTIADDIPDSKTVWHFRARIVDLDLSKALFDLFINKLESLGLILNEGKIVDASFVEVPRQHKRAKRANTSWRSATRTQGKSCEHGTEGDRGSLDKEKQRVIFWL
jgi:IS5 family transposase